MPMLPLGHYQNHLETELLCADPITLVKIVYEAILDAVQSARRYLHAGQIAERSAAISKAVALLQELATSLDHEKGGEISRNLVELYDYMQRQLLRSNVEQSDIPLAEVNQLLNTLLEAWHAVADSANSVPAGSAPPPAACEESAAAYHSVSYSF